MARSTRRIARDFSRPRGQRLRITMGVYDARTRTFKAVGRAAALITVQDGHQRQRLWKRIEDAVLQFAEEATNGTAGPGDSVAPASSVV